jgi:hypothetical protein
MAIEQPDDLDFSQIRTLDSGSDYSRRKNGGEASQTFEITENKER